MITRKADSNIMGNESYGIPAARVFCQENVRKKGKITYFPIYMVAFLERTQAEENVYKFDLTGLDHV